MSDEPLSSRQQSHYDAIHAAYETHYGDAESLDYRRRFFLDPLLAGIDLNDLDVADLAAGAGYTTVELLSRYPRIRPIGFDISREACKVYTARTGCIAHRVDLTRDHYSGPRFDAAIVVGGLHHCVSDLKGAFQQIAAMIRSGGVFLMVEPSRDCWIEPLRRAWYRRDRYFEASTEAALSHDEILDIGREWFTSERIVFQGGPAYFLIYNSLVLRVSQRIKPFISRPLFASERLFNRLPGKVWFPYFVARWRRR